MQPALLAQTVRFLKIICSSNHNIHHLIKSEKVDYTSSDPPLPSPKEIPLNPLDNVGHWPHITSSSLSS